MGPAGLAGRAAPRAPSPPGAEAFGGPIRAGSKGPAPRACGRERRPITTLDLGTEDAEAEMVWGANMAVRRAAFERVGRFDESVAVTATRRSGCCACARPAGRSPTWRARASTTAAPATTRACARSRGREYHRGRAARRTTAARATRPACGASCANLAGAGWHTVRRACPQGLIMGAHSAGRLAEALRPR